MDEFTEVGIAPTLEKREKIDISEAVENHPNGVFVYYHTNRERVQELQQQLQDAMPERLVIVSATGPGVFPADIGMQVGENIYAFTAAKNYLVDRVAERVDSPKNEIVANLAEMKLGGNDHLEGGNIVNIPNSGKMIIGYEGGLPPEKQEILEGNGVEVVYPANLVDLLHSIPEKYELSPEDKGLYMGHLDVVFTGVYQKDEGAINYYIDEHLYTLMEQHPAVDREFVFNNLQPIPHDKVLQGALNIKYVDNNALITTREIVGEDIINDLEGNGFNIIELGPDQYFNQGGVKCRSLDVTWNMTTQ